MASQRCSAPDIWWTVVALLSTCLLLQQQAGAKPQFKDTPYVASLNAEENVTTQLLALPCSGDDNDTIIVTLKASNATTPSNPCGNCFQVQDCISPDIDFCLFYLAGMGKLDSNIVQSYAITVECTDGTPGGNATETVNICIVNNVNPDCPVGEGEE